MKVNPIKDDSFDELLGVIGSGGRGAREFQLREDFGNMWVSTVRLPIEHHGGMWYETMIFPQGSWCELFCERYTTQAEAEVGHAAVLRPLRTGTDPSEISLCPRQPYWT